MTGKAGDFHIYLFVLLAATTMSKLFSKDALYSWGSNDILRKVIYISSDLEGKIDDAKKTLVVGSTQPFHLTLTIFKPFGTVGALTKDYKEMYG